MVEDPTPDADAPSPLPRHRPASRPMLGRIGQPVRPFDTDTRRARRNPLGGTRRTFPSCQNRKRAIAYTGTRQVTPNRRRSFSQAQIGPSR